MASSTPIESIPPVIEYLLYGTFGLLCLAVTIGVVILMRRHATRDEMTGLGEIDYPKIADQLQKEILRLQALRDRIYPEGAADAAIAQANRPVASVSIHQEQGASLASMSEDDLKELPEVQSLLQREMDELNRKHQEAIANLQNQTGGGVESVDTSAKDSEIKSLQVEIEELKAKAKSAPAVSASPEEVENAKKMEIELKGLKERLQEYEIFEDDLSRVKELSRENEQLKKQLGGGGASTLTAPVIEATAVSDSELGTASPDAAPEEVNEAAFEAAVESESAASLLGDDKPESVVEAKATTEIPKGFEAESVTQGPAISSASTEPSEGIPEDDLMAEFEKLLGSVDKV